MPRQIRTSTGSLAWPRRAAIAVDGSPEILGAAIDDLGRCCRERAGSDLRSAAGGGVATVRVRWAADCDDRLPPPRERQGYTLAIGLEGVTIDARSAAGAAYGLRTLAQLIDLSGGALPLVEIVDEPDFEVRGLSYDISRGRVPTMDSLFQFVDYLAALKANHLQLYTEHTFEFAFDREISAGSSPTTPDEIRELDAYCRARFIELTPSLACFGHMAKILSLPRYRDLAEVDLGKPWAELTWRERVRGLTIDASNPESRLLLGRMLDEYLPLFSSPRVNVCCDETFDLAQGRGKARANRVGVGALFLEHVLWLREHCAKHGKQIMIWGDMLKHHPDMIARLPADVMVLNWGYGAECDYDSTKLFTDTGLPTWVCPGTSGWNRFVHDINTADLNIRRYAAAGLEHGATGLLNTEWGDDGHVAPPGCALSAIVLGAAMGWNTASPARDEFDATFARLFLGAGGARAIAAWRVALAASDMQRIWPVFYGPETLPELPPRFDNAALGEWLEAARVATLAFAEIEPRDDDAADVIAVHAFALGMHGTAAQRLLAARSAKIDAETRAEMIESIAEMIDLYRERWLIDSRPSGLDEVVSVFDKFLAQLKS